MEMISIIIFLIGLIFAVLCFMFQTAKYEIIACLLIIYLYLFKVLKITEVFIGFSNNAVVTIALITVISKCITKSNSLSFITKSLTQVKSERLFILVSMIVCAFMSAFINNVGALTIMMPIVYQGAKKIGISISYVLLPLAYASVLGGMTTSIGTPPNLIVNNFASSEFNLNFSLFDYGYLGLPICLTCILILTYIYPFILPKDKKTRLNADERYLVEFKLNTSSSYLKNDYSFLYNIYNVTSIIRDNRQYKKLLKPDANDLIIVNVSFKEIQNLISDDNITIIGQRNFKDIVAVEALVPFGTKIENKTLNNINISNRFNLFIAGILNTITSNTSLQSMKIVPGMQILLLGNKNYISEQIEKLGLVNLNFALIEKNTSFKNYIPILSLMVALLLSSLKILDLPIALLLVLISLVFSNIIRVKDIYKMVDWSIVTLVAFLLPLGKAMENIQLDDFISKWFVNLDMPPFILITLLLAVTMTLSDFINNTATVVIMLPIAKVIALSLQTSPEPWLMAVAVGASCAFLTPISHQNNTLVMKPGKYKFFHYVKLGLPIEISIVIIFATLIKTVWPL
jgi:di/tricarboxylate transporter